MQVKVSKSVLQNLLRKSLSESSEHSFYDSDPSRRLSIDDEMMTLPSELPLRPSDRMAVQLDAELPPIEDPEYVPANKQELALALHALAEMVPDKMVEKAYRAVGRVIEQLSSESSEDPIVQFESLYRKHLLLQKILGEQVTPDEEEDDGAALDDEEAPIRLSAVEQRAQVEKALKAMRFDEVEFDEKKKFEFLNIVTGLIVKGALKMDDLDHAVRLVRSVPGLKDLAQFKFEKALMKRADGLAGREDRVKSLVLDELPADADRIAKRAAAAAVPAEKPSLRGTAQRMGYAAESGLRQALVGNIQPLWALRRVLFSKSPESMTHLDRNVYGAFKDAVTDPNNREFNLELLHLDEAELDEYIDLVNARPQDIKKSEFYKNFLGLVMFESLSRIAELTFRSSGRPIAKAYMKDFGEPEISPEENRELMKMQSLGLIDDEVDEILDEAGKQQYRGLFTGAVMMTAQDEDMKKVGKYLEPAFTTFKKQGPGTKPPELIVKDYREKFAKHLKDIPSDISGDEADMLDPEEHAHTERVKQAALAALKRSRK